MMNDLDDSLKLSVLDINETFAIDEEIKELNKRKEELLTSARTNLKTIRDNKISYLKKQLKIINRNKNLLLEYAKLVGISSDSKSNYYKKHVVPNLYEADLNDEIEKLDTEDIFNMNMDEVNKYLFIYSLKETYIEYLLMSVCSIFGHQFKKVDNICTCIDCLYSYENDPDLYLVEERKPIFREINYSFPLNNLNILNPNISDIPTELTLNISFDDLIKKTYSKINTHKYYKDSNILKMVPKEKAEVLNEIKLLKR